MLNILISKEFPKFLIRSLLRLPRSSRCLSLSTRLLYNKPIFNVFTIEVLNPSSQILSRFLTTSSGNFAEAEESEDKPAIDPAKDRTKIIPPETSIRYLKSAAYKETYGDEPVWVKYRRNFKGQFVPNKTRKSCVRKGVISTGNPCPICRDEYLVLDYTNVELLKQFIHPNTGSLLSTRRTHVCQRKYFELQVAVSKAKSYGLLTYEVPFREYDYKEYYPNWKEQ